MRTTQGRGGGHAHKRVGSSGAAARRRRTRQPPRFASGRVRFRFVFFRRRRRAAREALEVVEPRRGQGSTVRVSAVDAPAPAGVSAAVLAVAARGVRQLHQRRSRRHERRGERRPPPRRPSRGRLRGARGWLGVRADTRTETRRRRARRMRAWGRGGGRPARVRRRECGRASHFFGSREKKCLYGCGEHAGSVASPRSARLGEETGDSCHARAAMWPQSRRRRLKPVRTSHTRSHHVSPNEKISGFAVWASRNSSASVLSLGSSRVPSSSQRAERSRFPSRRVRGLRARPRGVALALGARDARVDDAPRERRRPGARRGARDLARLEKKRARATPNDAGDAAARAARARAEGAHRLEPSQKQRPRNVPTRRTTARGARRGHVTRGGSGREGLGAARAAICFPPGDVNSSWRTSAEASEAANASNAVWPKGGVPPLLRCSGCELTLRGASRPRRRLRGASGRGRGSSPPRRPRRRSCSITGTAACGALAADEAAPRGGRRVRRGGRVHRARVGRSHRGCAERTNANERHADERHRTERRRDERRENAAEEAKAAEEARRWPATSACRCAAVAARATAAGIRFFEGFEGVDSDAFNVTRAAISVCAACATRARGAPNQRGRPSAERRAHPFAREVHRRAVRDDHHRGSRRGTVGRARRTRTKR